MLLDFLSYFNFDGRQTLDVVFQQVIMLEHFSVVVTYHRESQPHAHLPHLKIKAAQAATLWCYSSDYYHYFSCHLSSFSTSKCVKKTMWMCCCVDTCQR